MTLLGRPTASTNTYLGYLPRYLVGMYRAAARTSWLYVPYHAYTCLPSFFLFYLIYFLSFSCLSIICRARGSIPAVELFVPCACALCLCSQPYTLHVYRGTQDDPGPSPRREFRRFRKRGWYRTRLEEGRVPKKPNQKKKDKTRHTVVGLQGRSQEPLGKPCKSTGDLATLAAP